MDTIRVEVNDGKYMFVCPAGDYRVHILRSGKPWVVIDEGCNAVLALMLELETARKEAQEPSPRK